MELTLISARDLKKATVLSKTKPYTVAWISNNHKNRQRTPVDRNNGNDPNWNNAMKFTLDEAALQQGRLLLEIAVYAEATFRDKEIGRISTSLNEFLNPGTTSAQFVSYQIRKSSGKPKGLLNLSVKLAGKAEVKQQLQPQAVAGSYGAAKGEPVIAYPAGSFVAAKAEPVTAYQFYPPAGSSSHPPPNNHYPAPPAGYPPPPPYYQAYSPPPYQGYPANQGYTPNPSYPPVVPAAQQPARKNNKMGMGLGTGLVGGALGGLLLGDIISDASYDAGFDDGYYGDGGDFCRKSINGWFSKSVPEIWQAAQMTESVYGGFGLDYCGQKWLFFCFIALIPTSCHPVSFSDFRWISLCNNTNKFISKVIAGGIKEV